MELRRAIDLFLEGYFSTCQRSDKTIQAYRIDLEQFEAFIGSRKRLASIESEHLEAWASEMKEAGYAAASIRRKFASVKVFLNYWIRKKQLDRSPAWQLRLDLVRERKLPTVLTVEEIRRLFAQAKKELGRMPRKVTGASDRAFLALRNLVILELLFSTGMRVGELTKLMVNDIDLENQSIMIHGKGGRQRMGVLPDSRSCEILQCYLERRSEIISDEEALLLNGAARPLSTQGVASILMRLSNLANIRKRITPHVFRHTVATLLLSGGADIRVVQRLLGHTEISTTQVYAHVTDQFLGDTMIRCHPLCTLLKRR